MSWAYGRCGLAYNRDFVDPASGRDICGLNTAEKADDTLLVGRVTDDKGVVKATIVNYACHPVSMGEGQQPADIARLHRYHARDRRARHKGDAVCVFLHGASGDLTPRRSYESDARKRRTRMAASWAMPRCRC